MRRRGRQGWRSAPDRRPSGTPSPRATAAVRSDPRRVAMLSVHTSPLDQPGTGDAGGMNVYVAEVARRLAAPRRRGRHLHPRDLAATCPPSVELAPGVTVRHVDGRTVPGAVQGGPAGAAVRRDRRRAAGRGGPPPRAGTTSCTRTTGSPARSAGSPAERWNVPLVHTMHTMAKVKNLALADGDRPEPGGQGHRRAAGRRRRRPARRQHRGVEADQLVDLYDADPDHVDVVHPGVDLDGVPPGDRLRAARRTRRRAGEDSCCCSSGGSSRSRRRTSSCARWRPRWWPGRRRCASALQVVVCGGPSGIRAGAPARAGGPRRPSSGCATSCASCRRSDRVQAAPTGTARPTSAVVPSHSESFGLVAVEAQACGTPVVAARVGGLPTAVADGVSGLLVDGHDP